jgi:predicted nucleic acid-binding protein
VILADTSIWIDHLRAGNAALEALLVEGMIAGHPLVTAELALGSLRGRVQLLRLLDSLQQLPVARTREVRTLVETHRLHGRGIGYVDTALLASCLLAPGTRLWTGDRRLAAVADELGVGANPAG